MNGEDSGAQPPASEPFADSQPESSLSSEPTESTTAPSVPSPEPQHRPIAAYIAAVLAALVIGGGVIAFFVSRDGEDDQVLPPTTTTSSSSTSSTTSTTLDPRQKYVGLEHDDRGAGLALGAEIRSIGYRVEGFETPIKAGDYAYFWVRDEKGDMLWLDKVTKPSSGREPLRAKVEAVWDLPEITDDQILCLGWCYNAQNKQDIAAIVIFGGESGKAMQAWRVDVNKPSFDSVSTAGWKQYLDVVEPEITVPPRPQLYGAAATGSDEERAIYNAEEQVIAGGGGTVGTGSSFVIEVLDHKENKRALVSLKNDKVIDTVVFDMVPGASVTWGAADNPPFSYEGKPDANVIVHGTFDGATLKTVHVAYRVDPVTNKFVKLDSSKVSSKS